jgi:hypothetical protein
MPAMIYFNSKHDKREKLKFNFDFPYESQRQSLHMLKVGPRICLGF